MSGTATTRTLSPSDASRLDEIINSLPDGSQVILKPGHYAATLFLEHAVAIRGDGEGVVIDADGNAPTVSVIGEHAEVTLEHLTLKNGSGGGSGSGGNLHVLDAKKVVLRRVRLEDGESNKNGGGGLLLHGGTVEAERCWFSGNAGSRAQAILVSNGSLTLRDSVVTKNSGIAPAILVDGSAHLLIDHSTVASNDQAIAAISVLVATSAKPTVVVDYTVLGDPPLLVTRPEILPRGSIVVRHSALPSYLPPAFSGGDNVVGPLQIDQAGRLMARSSADAGIGPR